MRGIEPRASRMQSERSTIWATSPFGFYNYDMVSYWIGSSPSQLELGSMSCRVGSGRIQVRVEREQVENSSTWS